MAMSAPFYKLGAFGDEASLVVAFLIGIGFGFFLERAGFGSARKLVSQFYLNDLAVFKVMFTAIVTAMLGVTYLLGFAAGTLGFALAFPLLKGLYTAGDLGTKTLPQVLGIPYGILVFGVVLMAVGGFMGASWIERKMAAKAATE
jgi:hypothetical protein